MINYGKLWRVLLSSTSVGHLPERKLILYSVSIDIDVLDPSAAPATGTPETGGWTSRELRKILRGLDGLDIVGAYERVFML